MSLLRLIWNGLRHYWRTHLGVVLGTAVGTAVLVGALVVGDSVRHSLREQALNRIGQVDLALASGERLFGAQLARAAPRGAGAAVLALGGIASARGGRQRANQVHIHGVDDGFFALARETYHGPRPAADQVLLNAPLAAHLGVTPGESILLRLEQPSDVPRDMVLATTEDISQALRVEVRGVLGAEHLGDFSLVASQIPPFNAFVALPWLQERLGFAGRANLLLLHLERDRAQQELRQRWTLEDAELRLEEIPEREVGELVSRRIFIDDPVVAASRELEVALTGVLTYFVNELRVGPRSTPYSMVTALGPLGPGPLPGSAIAPDDLADDEIVINRWLADDLETRVGERLTLTYFVLGPSRRLVEQSRTFRIHSVVALAGEAADRTLMPAFPGLAEEDNCRDWEPGIPLELDRIRDKDEQYWDEHRGTPKAFVTLRAGQAMWGNRFGSLTAIRVPPSDSSPFAAGLRRALDPAALGLFLRDVRTPALEASAGASDFGLLFLGLSFFLIVAALILTTLLFVFGVDQRAAEVGTYLALGFRHATIRRIFLGEAFVLATLGAVIGALAGTFYTRAVLHGLATIWREAVAHATIEYHAAGLTVVVGAASAALAALLSIGWTLRRLLRREALELLASRGGVTPEVTEVARGEARWSLRVAVAAFAISLVLLVIGMRREGPAAAGIFFGAAALLLIASISASRHLLARLARRPNPGHRSVAGLGASSCYRRPGRSLATIALLACGSFLVVSMGAHRLGAPRDPSLRSSGTGGFALLGRSTLPVLHDLDSEAGREAFALEADELQGVAVVALRVRAGDDASCLNLSLPRNPRMVGVRPAALAARGAFTFAGTDQASEQPWRLLERDLGEGVIPAIGDQASLTWSLHKGLGDELEYRDERGRPFRVRIVGMLAGSILQGDLVIAEERFVEKFPSDSGHRMFLVDVPRERTAEVAATLTRALEDVGLELVPAVRRLDELQAVQNTYLLVFQVLGGLGLLLGSVGLGMVVLRNVLERRSELALLRAVGYSRHAVRALVLSEHGLLLLLGLGCGTLAAALAVLPSLADRGAEFPYGFSLGVLAAVGASSLFWVWLATISAVRGPLVAALRNE